MIWCTSKPLQFIGCSKLLSQHSTLFGPTSFAGMSTAGTALAVAAASAQAAEMTCLIIRLS